MNIQLLNQRHKQLVTHYHALSLQYQKLNKSLLRDETDTSLCMSIYQDCLVDWFKDRCLECFNEAQKVVFGSTGNIQFCPFKYRARIPELNNPEQAFDFNVLYHSVIEEWEAKKEILPLMVAAKTIREYFNLSENDDIECKKGYVCLISQQEWKWMSYMSKDQAKMLCNLANSFEIIGHHLDMPQFIRISDNIETIAIAGREIISRDGYKDPGVSELTWFKSGKIEFLLNPSLAESLANFLVKYEAYSNSF